MAMISSVGSTQSIGIELQRSVGQLSVNDPLPSCSASYLNLPASNNFAANQTVTFLIERMPLPKLIEAAQCLQFICVGQRK